MFFYRVILLFILCGTIAVCSVDEKLKNDDQVAIASENIALSSIEFEEPITETNSSTELPELDDTTDIHYENSNGFVPMISSQKFLSSELLINSTNTTINNDTTESPIISLSDYDNDVENNPAFFTEARILLNIQPTEAERRSYDTQDGQKEFELLKVNKQTSKIANYHEFYENMQSNLKNNVNNMRTKNRIKQINDYLSDDFDQDKDNTQVYSHYYANKNNKPIITTETMFEPEKVNQNYPQNTASKYGNFDESVTHQKTSNLPHINYDSNNYPRDNKKYQQLSLKPVVVIEPSDYKVDVKYNNEQTIGQVSTSSPYDNQKKINDESEDRYDKNDDGSNESLDYLEITERPKKIYKSRRRPYTSENSRKLIKEHRGSSDGNSNVDDTKKINSSSLKTKSHRSRAKPNYWTDDEQNNSNENQSKEEDNNNNKNTERQNNENSWNQVGQNIELSQSNSFQLDQNNKPNVLVPVNLNLVPLTNFDHSTAIGTSQGFDISNAGLQNYITAGPIVSTASPLISSTGLPNINPSLQNSGKNYQQYSTPLPEIVVGQSTYQNPLQTVFLQNKYPQNNNIKTQYFQSTVAPVFTVSQSTIAPKSSNQDNSQVHHLLVSQPTLQTILQSPLNGYNNNILINTRGLNGQNQQTPIQNNNNNAQTVSSEIENSSKKTTFTPTTSNQYLTSASYSVNNNLHNNIPASSNINSVIANNQNNQQLQQIFPAFIQQQQQQPQQQSTNFQPTYITQLPKQWNANTGNAIFGNTWAQLQTPDDPNKNFKQQFQTLINNNDNLGSTSNNNLNTYNAIQSTNKGSQLPVVGMQTVQIQNPNFNPFNQYQGGVLTTPVPILTSTTPNSMNIHSYVDSLTHIGSQNNNNNNNNNNNQWRTFAADRPAYNPMNFVPSTELVDSQIMLNSKSHIPDSLSHNLNLVPAIPGGNFYKNSPSSQLDLIKKPKLSTDLEKYAEEMFKESLRTIYNTHKWNSDKKIRNLTIADIAELKRLKDELDRIKSNMVKSKNIKEIIEGHQSETNFQTVDPGPLNKRPGITVSELEHLFKTEFNNNDSTNNNDNIKINDYLTPPKVNSFVTKSPFVDNNNNNIKKQVKKRPNIKGTRNEINKLRPHNRPHGKRPTSGGIEAAASSHSSHSHRRPYKNENHSGRKEKINYNNYPTFTTSSPDLLFTHDDYKYSKNDELDFDSPKLHNLLGLLMKNKQLPKGASSSLYRDNNDDIEKYLDDEQRRAGYEFNNDKINNFQITNSQPYLIRYY